MPLFDYIATDAVGQQRSGQLSANDEKELIWHLNQIGLVLISCHVPGSDVLPGENTRIINPDLDIPGLEKIGVNIPTEPAPKRRQRLVQTPAQYLLLAIVFVSCVVLGYFIGQ